MSNNKTKLFLLFTLIFIATIGISAATAADIDNNATDIPVVAETPTTDVVDDVQTTYVDNKAEITKNTQTDVKTDGEADFTDLKTDIDAASEVTLTKDYKHVSEDSGLITINSDKTIDGAGHTISNVTSGLFSISAGNTVTLKNLIITGGDSIDANIITINAATFICENVTFDIGNTQRSSKSIVYYNEHYANTTYNNCTFKNFWTTQGGLYLYRVATLNVDGCTFENISAVNNPIKLYSGILDSGIVTTISNSKFINNGILVGSNQGGALCFNNYHNIVFIDNCLFENNTASAGGGAIRSNGNLTLTNSVFRNNKNSDSGAYAFGAICLGNGNGNLITSNNTMDDPEAQLAEIFIYDGKVRGAKITGETINADANEEVTVTYTITDDNGNGILYRNLALKLDYNDNEISISNNTDVNRGVITKTVTAPAEDGTYPATLIYDEARFVDPVVTVAEIIVGNPGPGALILTDETWDQFFNENGTPNTDVVESGSELEFHGTFTNRQMNITIPLTITTGDQQAVFDGCTFYINDDVTMKNIEATNTNVVVSSGNTLNLYNDSFADMNTNKRVFDVNASTVNVEKSTFTDLGYWGVFYLLGETQANFKECNFTNCSNSAGGAIEIRNGGAVCTIENCIFNDNSATLRGGAIYSKGNLTIRNSEFTGNSVTTNIINKNQGGAVLFVEGDLYLYNNRMTDNTGLTADIYNSFATIHTPVNIEIDDVHGVEGTEVELTAKVTDADGNTIDLIATANGISGLEDVNYLLNLNLTVEDNKYNVTRNQSLKGIINRPVTTSLAPGNYTIGAEVWADELVDPRISNGNLEIIETPNVSYAKLQSMVDEATEDSITLDNDVVRGAEEIKVMLNKSITIDMNGLTWDATQGQAIEVDNGATATIKNGIIINVDNTEPSTLNIYGRLARVTSGNLIFENVTFTNSSAPDFGSSGRGSLVRITTGSSVTLNNCTVENIKGRFIIDNGRGTININNTNFNNNKLDPIDSLIENAGVTTITNTQFDNNTANWGIIYGNTQRDLLTLDNVTFTNNVISVGAPVAVKANANVVNSKFMNNKATKFLAKSGAIFTNGGSLTVSNSTFIGNTANGNEGTIIHHSGYIPGDLSVTNSVLIPADAKSAIYNEAEDDITAVANYNYWGTNSTPAAYVKSSTYYDDWDDEYDCTPIEVKYWVVMNSSIVPEEFSIGEEVVIETSYNKYTDGTEFYDLEGAFPDMEITYTVSEGSTNPETATTENGVANVAYTVTADSFTVTATDSYTTNVIEAEASPSEPVVITLNDGNWTEYFNDDGTTKRMVTPGSELRFEGEFNNRHMLITLPLNLTTADTQAVLNNCSFTVITGNVNITNLQMNANDLEDYLIDLEEADNSRIENNVLTQTNNGQRVVTHTIDITDSDNVVIRNNTVTTVGPEETVEYDSRDQIRLVYTIAVNAKNSNAIVIDSNNITAKGNGKTASAGTIYAVNVMGEFVYDEYIDEGESDYTEHDYPANAQIINNIVKTETDEYGYAINLGHAVDGLVDNNTVTGVSKNYADAIQGYNVYDTKFTNNNINITSDNMGYGILVNGYMHFIMDWEEDIFELSVLAVEGNEVSGNVIDITANDAWAVEVVIAYDNTVEYNNITLVGNNGVGIGFADSEEGVARYNNIDITASQETGSNVGDAIDSYTTGVKITPSDAGIKLANENTAVFNNITITAANDDVPAINVSSTDNTVTDNYLIAPTGIGDNAVLDTGEDNTVENNLPEPIITDETYPIFFDEYCSLKPLFNNTELTISGDFVENTIFIFDGVNVTITSDGTAKINEGQVMTGNNATVVFDGWEFLNSMDVFVLESESNVINNTKITIMSEDEIHAIYVYEDGNIIANTNVTIFAPSADVDYNPDFSTKVPAPAAIVLSSDNNVVDNVRVFFTETESTGNSPTIDGIYIISSDEPVTDNTIKDTTIVMLGENFAYGINVGNAKDTTIENVNITLYSDNYADAIQLFDADTITITGVVLVGADSEAYGVYSTAMGKGFSQNIDLTGLDVTVIAPKATGVLLEGASYAVIADATYNITGDEATAIKSYVDWMGNIPTNITITGLDVLVDTTGDANILYFGKAADVSITDNHIETTGGSEINFNETPNAVVTDNYITIGEMLETGIFGNYAVITTEDDTVIENNTPTSKLIDDLNDKIDELLEQIENLTSAKNTTISIDPLEDVKYGDEIEISGLLVNEDYIGLANQNVTIRFNDEETTVTTRNGEFTYTTTAAIVGENTITVSFAGSDKYRESEATYTFEVAKADTIINLTDIEAVKKGETAAISGILYDHNGNALANKVVRLLVNNGRKTVKTNDMGEFSFDYTTTRVGEMTLTATFEGNDLYEATTTETAFEVNALSAVITLDPMDTIIKGTQATITGTLTDENGNAIANAQVRITINGSPKTLKTDSEGRFTHTYTMNAVGENTITAIYEGSANYEAAECESTVEVVKGEAVITLDEIESVTKGETATFTGTLTDADGNAIANAQVKIIINGSQKTLKTDANGAFTHTFKMTKEGTNNITATFNGNNDFEAAEATSTVEVIKAE